MDHEGQALPSEGTSAQHSPEPALEREVIEVAPGKTAVAVITLKLFYRINGDAQDVYDMPAQTAKSVDDFAVPKRCRPEGAREASFVYSDSLCYSIAMALLWAVTQVKIYRPWCLVRNKIVVFRGWTSDKKCSRSEAQT